MILSNANSYMKSLQQSEISNFTIDSKLPGNPFTHKERIDGIMGLVEFLIVNSKSSNLDFQQLSDLYTTFVS
jgi:hypothetical protein